MLSVFREMNGMGKEDYYELTELIYVEGREPYDIINFYNKEFVQKIKSLLYQIK